MSTGLQAPYHLPISQLELPLGQDTCMTFQATTTTIHGVRRLKGDQTYNRTGTSPWPTSVFVNWTVGCVILEWVNLLHSNCGTDHWLGWVILVQMHILSVWLSTNIASQHRCNSCDSSMSWSRFFLKLVHSSQSKSSHPVIYFCSFCSFCSSLLFVFWCLYGGCTGVGLAEIVQYDKASPVVHSHEQDLHKAHSHLQVQDATSKLQQWLPVLW